MGSNGLLQHIDAEGVKIEVMYEGIFVHEGLTYNVFLRDTLIIRMTWPDGVIKLRMLRPGSAPVIHRSSAWEIKKFTEQLVQTMRNQEDDFVIDDG